MAVDPGHAAGCKCALLDADGHLLERGEAAARASLFTVYPLRGRERAISELLSALESSAIWVGASGFFIFVVRRYAGATICFRGRGRRPWFEYLRFGAQRHRDHSAKQRWMFGYTCKRVCCPRAGAGLEY